MKIYWFLGVFLLVGCASTSTENGDEPESRSDCFNIRTINDFKVMDRRYVYIQGPGSSNHFLLTMFSSCIGLDRANVIALSNVTSNMCPGNYGSVTYRDMNRPQNCRISDIERVDSREAAQALVDERTQ